MNARNVSLAVPRHRARQAAWLGLLCALMSVLSMALPAAADAGPVEQSQVVAQDDEGTGVVIDILSVDGYLDPSVARTITSLLAEVQTRQSDLVILQVDGPGAISADVENVLAAIEASLVPVVVFVAPQQGIEARAGGAYAFMALAADYTAVASIATVGPFDAVDLADLDRQLEGFSFEVEPGPIVTGSIYTADEAVALGVADVVVDNIVSLLAELDGRTLETAGGPVTLDIPREQVTTKLHALGLLDRLLHAAASPAFIYLLLILGLGSVGFEWFQPGFGVAGIAGLVMLPFAVVGLTILPVTWWALALLLVGIALFHIDVAIAGLGPVTAAATAAFGVGSWWLFDTGVLRVPAGVAITMTLSALFWFVVVLTIILRAQAGPEGVDLADLVGRHGIVRSVLNPEGHVFLDDALWRARSAEGTKLKVGSPISVTAVDGPILVVAEFSPDGAARP